LLINTNRSPQQITTRLDRLIKEIRTNVHKPALAQIASGKPEKALPSDVIVVAHGHILRAFAARWVGRAVHDNPSLLLEAGGIGILRYVKRVGSGEVGWSEGGYNKLTFCA